MIDQTSSSWNPSIVPSANLVTPTTIVPSTAKKLVPVLHVVNGQHFAGAERVQMHLGRCLPQFGFRADFACLVPGKFHQQFDLSDSQSFAFPMAGKFDLRVSSRIVNALGANGYVGLKGYVGSNDYACIHAHTPRSAMIASRVARKLRLPWVYHVHSPVARDSARRFSNMLNSWVERWSLKSVDHLIVVSNSLREQLIRDGYDANQVTVIHNGVPALRPTRTAEPVVGGQWIVGMVALIRPRKGLEVALQALQQIRAAGHDLVLRCIGPFETDQYEASIRNLVDHLGVRDSVEFTGFTSNVTDQLAKLDAMVLPSLYGEGMPMVVLEAMAAGLPVVATRVEGTPEAIEHGIQGLLAEPNDADSLAEQLTDLLTGQVDWKTMSEAAVRRHRLCFSDQAMAERTADVYRSILHN